MILRIIPLVIASVSLSTAANAACYQQVVKPGQMICAKDASISADFAQKCEWQPQTYENVAVACPEGSASNGRDSGGGGERGGHYVDTNNDGKTDTFKEGAGKGTTNSGMSTKDSKHTSGGKAGSDTKTGGSKSGSSGGSKSGGSSGGKSRF